MIDGPQKLFFVDLVGLKESDVFFPLKRKCSPPKPLGNFTFLLRGGGMNLNSWNFPTFFVGR